MFESMLRRIFGPKAEGDMKAVKVHIEDRNVQISIVRFQVLELVSMKMTLLGYTALLIETVRTSETSIYFENTRHYIPDSCHVNIDWLMRLREIGWVEHVAFMVVMRNIHRI
jgi:hypothetical protein